MDNGTAKSLIAFGLTAIGTEHFFSATLSSPVSVKMLKQDAQDVRDAYKIATIFSVVFGLQFTILLAFDPETPLIGKLLPVVSAIILSLVFVNLYEKALKQERLTLI